MSTSVPTPDQQLPKLNGLEGWGIRRGESLTAEEVSQQRTRFHERVFNAYFISNIRKKPDNEPGLRLGVNPEIMNMEEFCRRNDEGFYVTEHLNPAFWAWMESYIDNVKEK